MSTDQKRLLEARKAVEERDRYKGTTMALHLALKGLVDAVDEAPWVAPESGSGGAPQAKAVPWSTATRATLAEVLDSTEVAVMHLVTEVKADLMRELMPKVETMLMLAAWLDKHGNDDSTEVQDDLRAWAREMMTATPEE